MKICSNMGRVEWLKREGIQGRKSRRSWRRQMNWRREGNCKAKLRDTLGVSIMTLHRWRKASHEPQSAQGVAQPNGAGGRRNRIAELQVENSRLRRLVT